MKIAPFLLAGVAALGAGIPLVRGQAAPEPPLPGEESSGPESPNAEEFAPLLEPGDVLPEGSEALPEPPEMHILPELVIPPQMEPSPEADFPDEELPLPPEFENEIIGPKLQPRKNVRLPEDPLRPMPLPGAGPGEDEQPAMTPRAEWLRNPRTARRISSQESKPLLLFFACIFDTTPVNPVTRRPMVQPTAALNDDLLTTVEFNEFAGSNLVLSLLHFPSNSQRSAKPEVYTPARLAALEKFKKYFKVKGFPCLILLDEQGREIERISGYRRVNIDGSRELYSTAHIVMDRLRVAVERLTARRNARQERLQKLTSAGYRQWTSKAGSTLFAKYVAGNADVLVLIDESGRRRRVRPDQLSILDRAWIHRKRTNSLPSPTASRPAGPTPAVAPVVSPGNGTASPTFTRQGP